MFLSLVGCALGITPTQTEMQRIVANDPQSGSYFGSIVDVYGETIAVGASGDDTIDSSSGAVYVFEMIGASFAQTNKIIPGDLGNGDGFGAAVAIAEDRLVVGAPGAHLPFRYGAVYVFERTGSTWTQEQFQLTPIDAQPSSGFGSTLDLEGDTLVVGAPGFDGQGGAWKASGAVYVFEHQGSSWVQQARLTPLNDNAGNEFGIGVSISGDALAIGATGPGIGNNVPGRAYVFRRNGTTWIQEAQFSSGASTNDGFGPALHVVGDRLVVGAPSENGHTAGVGAVYVFGRAGTSWLLEARLLSPTSSTYGSFGKDVTFMEGGSLVTTAPGEDDNRGFGHVFDLVGSQWQHRTRLATADALPPLANLGLSTASEGDLVLLGTSQDDVSGVLDAGAAYVYDLPTATSYCTAKTTSQLCLPFITATGYARISPGFGPFILESHDHVEGKLGMLLYGFKKAGLGFHGGTLCVKPPFRRVSSLIKHTDGVLCVGCGGSCRSFERNFNQIIQSGQDPLLTAGQRINAQWRQRDPADPLGFGDNLSDGLSFLVGP